jgi:hypothetical protein
MHPVLRAALTILCAAALAWPLLFWGKPALPDRSHGYIATEKPIYNALPRQDLLW